MNKKLKELSKQADLAASATYAQGPDAIWLKEYNKKFAELIVKECAEIARLNTREDSKVYLMIQEHFGVE